MGFVHGGANEGITVVAVDAPELDGLAVDQNHAVFNADIAHTHGLGNDFAAAGEHKGIQAGIFGAPEAHIVHTDVDGAAVGAAAGNGVAHGIVQLVVHRRVAVFIIHFNVHADVAGGVALGKLGMYKIIPDMARVAAQDVYVAEDAGHAQLVLILKIAAVAPLQHQYAEGVLALMDEFGNIEFTGGMGNLAVAHKAAVQPQIETGVHAFKHDALAAGALVLPVEAAHIQAAGILRRHMGRIISKGEADICILMTIPSVHLPYGRHRNLIPGDFADKGEVIFIVMRLHDALRQIQHTVKIAEGPCAVQGVKSIRSSPIPFNGKLFAGKGHEIGSVRQGVYMQGFEILMVGWQTHFKLPPIVL